MVCFMYKRYFVNKIFTCGDKMKTAFSFPFIIRAFLYFIFLLCLLNFISIHTANSDALDYWHQRGSDVTTEDLEAVVYGNGTFIAVGRNGVIVSSTDGVSWTSVSSGTSKWIKAIDYSNQSFKAVGWEGVYLTSTDGQQWNEQNLATTNDYHYDIIYADGLYAVVGYYNDITPQGNVITSVDGNNWEVDTMSFAAYHYGIAYGSNTYVAVGSAGTIISSPDCDIWTERTSGAGSNLISVFYANNIFLAVGADGVILTSDDGQIWSEAGTITSETLYEVLFSQDTWIAAGANGTLLTSQEGNIWEERNSGTTSDLKGIAFGNNTFVVVGDNGLILQSDPMQDSATINGTLYLPAEANGKEYVVLVDDDTDGDNGWIAATEGICGTETTVNYSISDVPAGTYYVYAIVRIVSDPDAGAEKGDYIGYYGSSNGSPSSANAVVPSSGTVTFDITMSVWEEDADDDAGTGTGGDGGGGGGGG